TAILGLLLLLAWVQDRSIQALAWWGAAYPIAGLSIAMLSGQIPINQAVSNAISSARLFDVKEIPPFALFAGALLWLLPCLIPEFSPSTMGRMIVGSVLGSNYT